MKTVMFICRHGASRSRMASAFFNRVAPPGWTSTSAGVEPQEAMSGVAVRLMSGTEAEPHLDRSPPRGVSPGELTVAIDCCVPGAVRWELDQREQNEAMRDEIERRVERLAADLS